MKCCTRCNETKDIANFSKDKKAKDGLRPWCKLCESENSKAKRQADPERYRRYNQKNYVKHREKRRKYSQQWYAQNKEKASEAHQRWGAQNQERKREYYRRWYAKNKEWYLAELRRQRKESPERFRLYRIRCYLKNIEKRKAYAERYRINNREKFRQYQSVYRQRHLRLYAPWDKDQDRSKPIFTEWKRRNEQQVSQSSAIELLSEIKEHLSQEQIAFLDALTDANFDLPACATMLSKNTADCMAMLLAIREIASRVKDEIG